MYFKIIILREDKKLKNESGVISLFVIFSLLFFLVFATTIALVVRNKENIETQKNIEIQKIYSKSDTEYATYAQNDEVIPIYNIEELNLVGSNGYVQIKDKIYQCSTGKQYLLKNNIIVDVEENLKSINIGFNDFKLYSNLYNIDKSGYDIYYYFENEIGDYWKNIAYQNFFSNDRTFVSNGTYTESNFSIVNEYKFPTLTFMMIWNDENGEFNNIDIKIQNKYPNNLNEIEVFSKNIKQIDRENNQFYIFVNIGNEI